MTPDDWHHQGSVQIGSYVCLVYGRFPHGAIVIVAIQNDFVKPFCKFSLFLPIFQ